MFKNKSKDTLIISHPINSQKIKNLIHLNDLKKLKKYSTINNNTNNNSNNNYLERQCKKIFRKLANKYNRGADYYNKKIITDIIDNEYSHLVASFKEYLIYGDYSEFLQDYFHTKEIKKFLPLIFEYYHTSTVIFPNYVNLEEKKYIYRNIQKKQQIINVQQEQEEKDKKKNNKIKRKNENNNDVINADSDSTSKSDVLTSHALNSILNQTNTSNNRVLFGLNNNNNNSQDLVDFIEKIKNVEKKINLKNKNQKKRNKHIIAIHKGNNNNLKKDNNKSNNTNTCNTISTKNNTKGKEKSNIDTKSFSDKNIKNNYNLSSVNLNYSKNINKYFLLKLGQIKRRNEIKTTKNILLELSSFNSSAKYKKISFFANKSKNSLLTEFCKGDIKKINNEKETTQIKNYNFKHIKRIKSYYGMNVNNSRNKNIFCESTIFSNNSNSSNKKLHNKNNSNFKVCSTLNNILNDNNIISIDEKKNKKLIPKKNRCVFDSKKIINVIYSKRVPLYTLKNSRNNSKKLIVNKTNKSSKNNTNSKKKIIMPLEKKKSPNEKQKKYKFTTSANITKMQNPFESRISPLYSKRNENKKIIKFAMLSPNNISAKFSASRLIQKKQLNKNIQLNNKKFKLKKEINKMKENKSNKIIIKKDIVEGSKYHFNTDFLTINSELKRNRSPNLIDMKKSIDNKSIVNSIKNNLLHYRTKTLYNKLPGYFTKYQK